MKIELPYGDTTVDANLENARLLDTLDIQPVAAVASPKEAIEAALRDPIGLDGPALASFNPGESVVIVVSDSFRQTRADQMVPVLLEELNAVGIPDENISILYSTGTHRGPTEDESRGLLGDESFARLQGRLFSHDAWNEDELVSIGTTQRGTPVEINRRLQEADRVIATGAIVYHYFGGFGGGRKSIVPGVASGKTIAANHSMNLHPTNDTLDPNVRIGALAGNPVAEDLLEASLLTQIDFILNTVLNRDGQIARVFAGDMKKAHEAGCAFAAEIFTAPISEQADIVVAASAGTKNFLQTHKSLFNAYQAVKPEGRIILVAPCAEGIGANQFQQWLRLGDRSSIIAALRKDSEINGQTALSTIEKSPITTFVTEMDEEAIALLQAEKASSLQAALDDTVKLIQSRGIETPTVYTMPSAAYTVPRLDT